MLLVALGLDSPPPLWGLGSGVFCYQVVGGAEISLISCGIRSICVSRLGVLVMGRQCFRGFRRYASSANLFNSCELVFTNRALASSTQPQCVSPPLGLSALGEHEQRAR